MSTLNVRTVRPFPQEPLLAVSDIQGNVLPGFNKRFQTLTALEVMDVAKSKTWLRNIQPRISTSEEVLSFNRLYRLLRARQGRSPQGFQATWTNIAFSCDGLKKLVASYDPKEESAFTLGMPTRSAFLGDPTKANDEGHPSNWVVGGPGQIPDILLIVASDDPATLAAVVSDLKASPGFDGLKILYQEEGRDRDDLPGHEHFGFVDGISQPGVRGRASDKDDDFLTDRVIDSADQHAPYMGKPGQLLVWPGEFIIGYPGQDERDPLLPGRVVDPTPAWFRNGSFVVFRRLRQDVTAFWAFVTENANRLKGTPGFPDADPVRVASLLVGRWPSGAPLMRSPDHDDPKLGADEIANNHFHYGADTAPVTLLQAVQRIDNFAAAKADPFGFDCPHAAHIRKVNPRDQSTEVGASGEVLTRRILRRGIPFGTPLKDPLGGGDDPLKGNRGLLFICYQASIEEQFEFISNRWMNEAKRPAPGGHDMLVGQNGVVGQGRVRQCSLSGVPGGIAEVKTAAEWVKPTGGGYFFSPSLSALRDVISPAD